MGAMDVLNELFPGRDGKPLELRQARGRGNTTVYDVNESVVSKLFDEGNIGLAEKEAADYLSKLWKRASVGSLSIPDLERIPGQAGIDITDIQADTISRLNGINKHLSNASQRVLYGVVQGNSFKEIERMMDYKHKHGQGRLMVIHCLRELAELTGHATRNTKWR